LYSQVHYAAKRFYFPSAYGNIRLVVVVHLDQVRVVKPRDNFFDLSYVKNIVSVASKEIAGPVQNRFQLVQGQVALF
jgi:hypothetical protein